MTVVAKFIATSFACYVVAFDSLKNYDLRLCAYDLHVSHASFSSTQVSSLSAVTVRNAVDRPCEITSCFAFSRLAIQRCSRAG